MHISLYNFGKYYKTKLSIQFTNPRYAGIFSFNWQNHKLIYFTKKNHETYIGPILSMLGALFTRKKYYNLQTLITRRVYKL